MTPFRFNLNKKIQAASVVLKGRGHMDRLRLLKILYIADRETLTERGCPIVGGVTVAMKHGPLHSEIYDLIKGSHSKERDWSSHIVSEGNTVALISDPGRMELSPYEIEKLDVVADRYATTDTWELSELTHGFSEWIENNREGTSTQIPIEGTLRAVGFTVKEIEEVLADAQSHQKLRELVR